MRNIITRFFPSKTTKKDGNIIHEQPITLTPVYRKRIMSEDNRRAYATELLDTYYGFGFQYVQSCIAQQINDMNIKRDMLKITRCLPLLQFFTNSVSRVYNSQPSRIFYKDGKQIVGKIESDLIDKSKFLEDEQLLNALNNLYNPSVSLSIKQAEKNTNLLNTTIYKAITNELGELRLVFLPNDTVQVKPMEHAPSNAEQIAFIQDSDNIKDNHIIKETIIENWTKDNKSVPFSDKIGEFADTENLASIEMEKLTGIKKNGYSFAPFVVFRDSAQPVDFWDQKNNDIVTFIRSINMSLTELKYLEKYTSFGLKYTVNLKTPQDGVMDPNGMISFSTENNKVPGLGSGKDYDIGEFDNKGQIEEVIKSIIFNLKMLFNMYKIPLDALVSTNSVRSADSKKQDSKELFSMINSQREVWNLNEQDLFKVLQSVHNRDNQYQIPPGIELMVDYEQQEDVQKTVDDWLVEIDNDVKTVVDWLASENPDLNRDQLMQLLSSNKELNKMYAESVVNLDLE